MNLPDCLSPHNIDLRTKGFWDKDYIYITLYFFDKCNLNCDFCFQDKSVPIDINRIKELPDKIIDKISPVPINPILQYLKFTIMGGELFSDDIPDSMFSIYEEVCNNVILLIKENLPCVSITLDWLTNGIFTNYTRVIKLLNNITFNNITQLIGLSYDPIGRFRTKDQFEMFINTFKYFHNYKPEISITLTKPNIYEIINNKDNFICNLSKEISIYLNYYISSETNSNWELYQPNDDDLFNFYKWAIDNNKFNIVSKLLKGFILDDENMVENSCMCKNFTLYINGEYMNDCVKIMSIYPGTDFYGKYHDNITWENSCEIRATLGFIKRGCFSCNYQHLCSGMCWCSLIFKGYDIGECPIQRLYDYIKNDDQLFHEIKSSILNEVNGI